MTSVGVGTARPVGGYRSALVGMFDQIPNLTRKLFLDSEIFSSQ